MKRSGGPNLFNIFRAQRAYADRYRRSFCWSQTLADPAVGTCLLPADQRLAWLLGILNGALAKAPPASQGRAFIPAYVDFIEREVLTPAAMAAFEAFGEMELFGKPFSSASLRQRLHLACQKPGVPAIHPHVLRHTFASWLVNEGGVSLKTASGCSGTARFRRRRATSEMMKSQRARPWRGLVGRQCRSDARAVRPLFWLLAQRGWLD